MLNPEQILAELISIPSVNPFAPSARESESGESRLTDYLESVFNRLSLPSERQTVVEGRENVFARLDGDVPPERGGRLILFDAHQDTVQVDGMTIPPWEPTVRDGRIYGRGSCDTKGGMSAMICALSRLADERPKGMATIVMACSIGEEFGGMGAMGAAVYEDFWKTPGQSIFPKPPDEAIIAEPTDLNVVKAHKGSVRWNCRTHGRAVHSSQPDAGDNAIYKMRHVLAALEDYQRHRCPSLREHPLCGRPTLSVGLIEGGRGINTVADLCSVAIDRRILPNEFPMEGYQDVIDHVAKWPEIDFEAEHEPPFSIGKALSDENNRLLSEHLLQVVRSVQSDRKVEGVQYGTNAGPIASSGVPCVVFGPGSIDQAHTRDEWLSIEQLHQACEILYRFGAGRGKGD